ncbi:hypothetical protein RI367_000862 [Sorochytrium milnesiophthora]
MAAGLSPSAFATPIKLARLPGSAMPIRATPLQARLTAPLASAEALSLAANAANQDQPATTGESIGDGHSHDAAFDTKGKGKAAAVSTFSPEVRSSALSPSLLLDDEAFEQPHETDIHQVPEIPAEHLRSLMATSIADDGAGSSTFVGRFGVQSEEKPYVCKFPGCSRAFTQSGNLRMHERQHLGVKPHKCPRCDKHFAQLGNLKIHERIHTGMRPYICLVNDCRKAFSQMGNLRTHQLKVHGLPRRTPFHEVATIIMDNIHEVQGEPGIKRRSRAKPRARPGKSKNGAGASAEQAGAGTSSNNDEDDEDAAIAFAREELLLMHDEDDLADEFDGHDDMEGGEYGGDEDAPMRKHYGLVSEEAEDKLVAAAAAAAESSERGGNSKAKSRNKRRRQTTSDATPRRKRPGKGKAKQSAVTTPSQTCEGDLATEGDLALLHGDVGSNDVVDQHPLHHDPIQHLLNNAWEMQVGTPINTHPMQDHQQQQQQLQQHQESPALPLHMMSLDSNSLGGGQDDAGVYTAYGDRRQSIFAQHFNLSPAAPAHNKTPSSSHRFPGVHPSHALRRTYSGHITPGSAKRKQQQQQVPLDLAHSTLPIPQLFRTQLAADLPGYGNRVGSLPLSDSSQQQQQQQLPSQQQAQQQQQQQHSFHQQQPYQHPLQQGYLHRAASHNAQMQQSQQHHDLVLEELRHAAVLERRAQDAGFGDSNDHHSASAGFTMPKLQHCHSASDIHQLTGGDSSSMVFPAGMFASGTAVQPNAGLGGGGVPLAAELSMGESASSSLSEQDAHAGHKAGPLHPLRTSPPRAFHSSASLLSAPLTPSPFSPTVSTAPEMDFLLSPTPFSSSSTLSQPQQQEQPTHSSARQHPGPLLLLMPPTKKHKPNASPTPATSAPAKPQLSKR